MSRLFNSRIIKAVTTPILLCGIFLTQKETSNEVSSNFTKKELKIPSLLVQGYSYNANNPSEDRWVIHQDPQSDISIGCIFDGHGGWIVSEYLSKNILNIFQETIKKSNNDELLIEKNLINMFHILEQSYIDKIRSAYELGFGEVAKGGSCVLLAYKYNNNKLIIANLGDCRAVIGTQSSTSTDFYSTRITTDHNSREPLEAILMTQKHPNENDIIICKNKHACYVKGRLQLTRALGDLYLKSNEFNSPLPLQS